MARCHIFVSGRVQGVGYRYFARREAMKQGLTGWVRNLSDGRVEALLEGDEDAVAAMLHWCARGPAGAHVDRINKENLSGSPEYDVFGIRS